MAVRILLLATTLLALSSAQGLKDCYPQYQELVNSRKCRLDQVNNGDCLVQAVHELQYKGTKENNYTLHLDRLDMRGGLPPGMFNNTKIHTLILSGHLMEHLNSSAENPFRGLEGFLKKFHLMNGHIETRMHHWHWKLLSTLGLEHITISEAPNTNFHEEHVLPRNFSALGSDSVTLVEITGSCLKGLEKGSLSTFTNVERINLSGNRLDSLERAVFPARPKKLRIIDLSGNMFKTIEAGSGTQFWNPAYASLREIYLDNNQIHLIRPVMFNNKFVKFRLNGNPLNCDCQLAWVLTKNLSVFQRPDTEPVKCASPPHLATALLSQLDHNKICPY